PEDFVSRKFDVAISISAIEHFGLNCYKENDSCPNFVYDSIAMYNIWRLLKPNGVVYLTVPFGAVFVEFVPHWRVYDEEKLKRQIIQNFIVEKEIYLFTADARLHDQKFHRGQQLSKEQAKCFPGGCYIPNPN